MLLWVSRDYAMLLTNIWSTALLSDRVFGVNHIRFVNRLLNRTGAADRPQWRSRIDTDGHSYWPMALGYLRAASSKGRVPEPCEFLCSSLRAALKKEVKLNRKMILTKLNKNFQTGWDPFWDCKGQSKSSEQRGDKTRPNQGVVVPQSPSNPP